MSQLKSIRILLIFGLTVVGFLVLLSVSPTAANADYYANCAPSASRQCVSNIVYWYDSCGVLQSVYQNCNNTNQICQNGQCVNKVQVSQNNPQPSAPSPTTPAPSNVPHDIKSCYDGNIYWYSDAGVLGSMYQSCADNNSCTLDGCAGQTCFNELKCDGSTCAVGSADYAKYCGNNPAGQNTTGQIQTQNNGLTISLFASQANNPLNLEKSLTTPANDALNFLMVIKNASDTPANDVSVTTNLPGAITYTGNLKIGTAPSAGSVVAGIDLGTLQPKTSQIMSFTGQVQPQKTAGTAEVTSQVSMGSVASDSDYLMLAIPASNAAAASPTKNFNTSWLTALFTNVYTHWYLWIIIIIVFVVVFIIIFRKLSSNV